VTIEYKKGKIMGEMNSDNGSRRGVVSRLQQAS